MGLIDAAVYGIHMLFAGLWAGSVLFVALAVLPTARDGTADPDTLSVLTDRLVTISRASALLLLLTGGHLAGTLYTSETLFGQPNGHLVLGMVALWLALAALVEVGSRRLRNGFDARKVREPAHEARPLFVAASITAVLLLLDAGLLISIRAGVVQL